MPLENSKQIKLPKIHHQQGCWMLTNDAFDHLGFLHLSWVVS